MSKTKKYKYFRKNRRGKNGKNSKHKTRRVQRGGNKNDGYIDVESRHKEVPHTQVGPIIPQQRVLPPVSKKPPELEAVIEKNRRLRKEAEDKRNAEHLQQIADDKAYEAKVQNELAAQQAAQQVVTPPAVTQQAARPLVNFNPKQSTGFGFGGDPVVTQQVAPEQQPAKAAEAKATGSIEEASHAAAPQQHKNFDTTPPHMGTGFQSEIEPESSVVPAANTVSPGSTLPNDKQRLTREELKNLSPEEQVAYLTRNALEVNKSREKPDHRLTLIPKAITSGVLGRIASIGNESQKNLAKEEVLTQFIGDLGEVIKDSEQQIEIIREYNRLLNEEIKKIYKEIVENQGRVSEENKQAINDLLGHVKSNTELIKHLTIEASTLVHAVETGNLNVLESAYGSPMSMFPSSKPDKPDKPGSFPKKKDDPGKGGVPADTNKKPGIFSSLFTRKKNKVAPATAEGTLAGETKEGTPPEGTQAETPEQKHIREQREQDERNEKLGIKRVQNGLIPKFQRGVTSAKNAVKEGVKTGFSNAKKTLKRVFSKKDTTGETEQVLNDDSGRSNDSNDSAVQKKTWREKLTIDNMKKSASERVESLRRTAKNALASTKNRATSVMNRITRKNNKGTTEENTQLLSGQGNEVEMQDMKGQPQQPQQLEAQAPRKPPPPVPPPRQTTTSSPLSDSASSQATVQETPRVPPPVPRRPDSFSALSKQSTVGDNDDSNVSLQPKIPKNYPRPNKPPPPVPIEMDPLSGEIQVTGGFGGGGKTRKNRQYIHEIKENRTHLFNKEMQILNSIRNFKHGQHHGPNERGKNKPENIQKKFIKVIKRS